MTNHSVPVSTDKRTRVVVLGGGYAGALAANRLQQNPAIDITVVNPRPHFVERVRLHEMAAGSGDATADLAELLGPNVGLVVDAASRVNAAQRVVELASGATVAYDYLVYAVGSTGTVPESVPGARKYSFPISELEQAEALRTKLAAVRADARICVIGGGLTGIETAAELAEQRPDSHVVLLCGGVLASALSERARSSVRRQLRRLDVDVDEQAVVTEIDSGRVHLTDGRTIAADVTIWTAGFGVPQLATVSGLRTDPMGRLLTDETLVSIDDPRIVAAGDSAAPSGQPLRMSCQAAMPLAARAAGTVLDMVSGRAPTACGQSFLGTNISIGRSHGTIQLSRKDDTPRGFHLGGKVAALIKEQVCKTVVKQIAVEGRRPGTYRWPGAKTTPRPAADSV